MKDKALCLFTSLAVVTMYVLVYITGRDQDHYEFDTPSEVAPAPMNKGGTTAAKQPGSPSIHNYMYIKHDTSTTKLSEQVEAFPPLGKDEHPNDINFNINRKFVIGTVDGSKNISIPKRIHFIWNNETVPSQFVDNLKSFLANNPDWDYYFWTHAIGRALIKRHHPELLPIFNQYRMDVMRADALRYIIIYHFGGSYFDLDTISLKSLDTVVEGEQCIVSPEPMENAVFEVRIRSLLANQVLLCSPGHRFFKFVIDRLLPSSKQKRFLSVAGPLHFTKSFNEYISLFNVLHSNRKKESIRVINYSVFLDRIRSDIRKKLIKNCPNLRTIPKSPKGTVTCYQLQRRRQKNSSATVGCRDLLHTYIRIEACRRWEFRGGVNRTLSPKALTDHMYYGTYLRPRSLTFLLENDIRNIIPQVKMYPDLLSHGSK